MIIMSDSIGEIGCNIMLVGEQTGTIFIDNNLPKYVKKPLTNGYIFIIKKQRCVKINKKKEVQHRFTDNYCENQPTWQTSAETGYINYETKEFVAAIHDHMSDRYLAV